MYVAALFYYINNNTLLLRQIFGIVNTYYDFKKNEVNRHQIYYKDTRPTNSVNLAIL